MRLLLFRQARKDLARLPAPVRRRIAVGIDQIQARPTVGKKLKGELAGYRRLRIGEYRIIYEHDSQDRLVRVVQIRPRGGAYR